MNLGNALLQLGRREGNPERINDAIGAYQAALKERTRERVPVNWAATSMNLANALVELGVQQRDANKLEEAIEVYGTALSGIKEETHPRLHELILKNRSNAQNEFEKLSKQA